jgi:hypothetical protein
MRITEEEYAAILARLGGQPPTLPRPVLLAQDMVNESRFMAAVIRAAETQAYKAYHTYRSTRSAPGFPDLVLAKPGFPLLTPEIKTNIGRVTVEQESWLHLLAQTEKPIAEIWRPVRWSLILERLGYPSV